MRRNKVKEAQEDRGYKKINGNENKMDCLAHDDERERKERRRERKRERERERGVFSSLGIKVVQM